MGRLLDPPAKPLVVLCPSMAPVGQLLRAQRVVLEWNESGAINFDRESLPLGYIIGICTGQ